MQPRVLLIEQECLVREPELAACADGLGGVQWERQPFHDESPHPVGARRPDLILLAASAATDRAHRLLEWAVVQGSAAPSLALLPDTLAEGVLRHASRALDDFLLWPARQHEFRERLARLLGIGRGAPAGVAARLQDELGLRNFVGQDPAFQAMVARLPRIARSEGNVLITGETGTGKELCARAIHHLGARRHGPFVAVDCGAFPDSTFENEMFGHAAGAFTDARHEQQGLAAMAEGGTLFLDEVDNLTASAQAKLLRFLQERCYRPLGSERFRKADVRVIAASNRDLESCVAQGRFRSDLLFRLNVLNLRLLPLRERRTDIPVLAQHFLEREPGHGGGRRFSGDALRKLALHDWPGNVRELLNVVQRAVVFGEGPTVHASDIALSVALPEPGASGASFRAARADAVLSFERSYVAELLRKHGGNITHAAREAQKERRAFGRLVKRLGLSGPTR
jgi:DNA-binding NtrC family response regulator